jgi:hypothetical protein
LQLLRAGQVLESIDHLLIQCPYAREFWLKFCLGKEIANIVPTSHEVASRRFSLAEHQPLMKRHEIAAVAIAETHRLWLEHNARTFDCTNSMLNQVKHADDDFINVGAGKEVERSRPFCTVADGLACVNTVKPLLLNLKKRQETIVACSREKSFCIFLKLKSVTCIMRCGCN